MDCGSACIRMATSAYDKHAYVEDNFWHHRKNDNKGIRYYIYFR